MKNARFRVAQLRPGSLTPFVEGELQLLGIPSDRVPRRLADLSVVYTILTPNGSIDMPATAYLAACSQKSRGVESDTSRTYAESLCVWRNYSLEHSIGESFVTEADIQQFRNALAKQHRNGRRLSAATVVLRVGTALRFIEWCHRREWVRSTLGKQLCDQPRSMLSQKAYRKRSNSAATITLPKIQSSAPRPVSLEDLEAIAKYLPANHELILKWAVSTGLRRAEIARLKISELEHVISSAKNIQIVELSLVRKGGRLQRVYVLRRLIDETFWHVATERPKSEAFEDHIFLSRRGTPITKESISRKFKDACRKAGVTSTFHGLRHTFALNVLDLLERQVSRGASINPLKTLQVLMGHASLETTDIYLQSLQVMSPAVEYALGFLYGHTEGDRA